MKLTANLLRELIKESLDNDFKEAAEFLRNVAYKKQERWFIKPPRYAENLLTIYSNFPDLRDYFNQHKLGVEEWFSNREFSNLDLTGIDFSLSSLENSNFSNCKMRHANLTQTTAFHTVFQGSDLMEAIFHRTGLSHANLYGTSLEGAQFSDLNVFKTDFADATYNKQTVFDNVTVLRVNPNTFAEYGEKFDPKREAMIEKG